MTKYREANGGSEFALLQNLLQGFAVRHLPVTARQALPGEKVETRHIAVLQPLAFDLSEAEHSAPPVHGHLMQARASGAGAALVVRVILPSALRAVPSSALPQVLERRAPETAPDLVVVGEQEKLPALLQFSLDLNVNKEGK